MGVWGGAGSPLREGARPAAPRSSLDARRYAAAWSGAPAPADHPRNDGRLRARAAPDREPARASERPSDLRSAIRANRRAERRRPADRPVGFVHRIALARGAATAGRQRRASHSARPARAVGRAPARRRGRGQGRSPRVVFAGSSTLLAAIRGRGEGGGRRGDGRGAAWDRRRPGGRGARAFFGARKQFASRRREYSETAGRGRLHACQRAREAANDMPATARRGLAMT